MNRDRWLGVLKAAGSGTARMLFGPITCDGPEGTHTLSDFSGAHGMTLLLCIVDGEQALPWGSGVLLSAGLGMTAKHVWQEYESQLKLSGRDDYLLMAFSFVGDEVRIWVVSHMFISGDSDLCLMRLQHRFALNDDTLLLCPTINAEGPKIGEPVLAIGYMASNEIFTRNTPIEVNKFAAVGKVTQILMKGRDRSMLPGPCCEFAATINHGMSGGPVFDMNGHLIGINSSSWHFADGGPPSSWCSLVLPALGISINQEAFPLKCAGNIDLLQMAQAGFVSIMNIDRFEVIRDDSDHHTIVMRQR